MVRCKLYYVEDDILYFLVTQDDNFKPLFELEYRAALQSYTYNKVIFQIRNDYILGKNIQGYIDILEELGVSWEVKNGINI